VKVLGFPSTWAARCLQQSPSCAAAVTNRRPQLGGREQAGSAHLLGGLRRIPSSGTSPKARWKGSGSLQAEKFGGHGAVPCQDRSSWLCFYHAHRKEAKAQEATHCECHQPPGTWPHDHKMLSGVREGSVPFPASLARTGHYCLLP
jgi:hypothetical protein